MTTYKLKSSLKAKPKSFPLNSKSYSKANSEADTKEKKSNPKGYEKLKKMEKKEKPNEIMGHITKKGKVYVSKKVPKSLRQEVAQHDIDERKAILRKKSGN